MGQPHAVSVSAPKHDYLGHGPATWPGGLARLGAGGLADAACGLGRLECRRLAAAPSPACTPDPLELDHILLRVAGRPVRHDYALLPAAVRPAGAVRGLAAGSH